MKRWANEHRHGIQKAVFIAGILIAVAVLVVSFICASVNKRIIVDYRIEVLYFVLVFLWCAVIIGYTLLLRYNANCDRPKIFTHDIAALLLDVVEDTLDKQDITIPDEEREGDEFEARIYGKVYDEMLTETERLLNECLERYKKSGFTIVTDVFE